MVPESAFARVPSASGDPQRPGIRSAGTWVLIGVPTVLLVLFAWQVWSGMQHADLSHEPVAVGRAALETDPLGSRIDLVLVDRFGQDTSADGGLTIHLREPDGGMWQTTRSVTSADFVALPAGGLLAGRLGYSVVVPAADWVRAPRQGGPASITIDVSPTVGTSFSTVTEERFP